MDSAGTCSIVKPSAEVVLPQGGAGSLLMLSM
jgi:hypothetical protein